MTPQQANLAPCPMCNNASPRLYHDQSSDCERKWEWQVCCDCDVSGPSHRDQAKAIAAWNRRAPAPTEPAVDRIAALELQLGTMRQVFHINMMKAHPGKSHEEISAAIDGAIERAGWLATPASPAVPGYGLSASDIDDMAFGYCPSGGQIGELREFAAALLHRAFAVQAVSAPAPLAPNLVDVIESMAYQGLVDLQARFPDDNAAQLRNIRASIDSDIAAMKADFANAAPQVPQASQPTSAEGKDSDNQSQEQAK